MVVTRSYFQVLGLQPILGRTFAENETALNNKRPPSAIMLGYDLWRRRFGGESVDDATNGAWMAPSADE